MLLIMCPACVGSPGVQKTHQPLQVFSRGLICICFVLYLEQFLVNLVT